MFGSILFLGCTNLLFNVPYVFYELSSLYEIFFEFVRQAIMFEVETDNFNFKVKFVMRQQKFKFVHCYYTEPLFTACVRAGG